jgi:hypothetical protein
MSFLGVVLLVSGQLPSGGWRFAATSVVAWKLLSLGPVVVIFWTAGRSVLAVRALVVGQLCWFLSGLISPQDHSSTRMLCARAAVSMLVWVGPWLLLAPQRSRLWRAPWPVTSRRLFVAAPVGVLLISWTVMQTHLDITGARPDLPLRELRFDMTGLPLILAASAVLAAVQLPRWGARSVALAWTYVGVLAVIFNDDWASPGRAVGFALVLAGIAYRLVDRKP